jgi:hypothetical protein
MLTAEAMFCPGFLACPRGISKTAVKVSVKDNA